MKISCNIIRDLFPSYIDKLTSDESNLLIEEHIAECAECTKILSDMQADNNKFTLTEKDAKELDFLKRNKKRTHRIALYCMIGTILAILLIIFIRSVGEGGELLSKPGWENSWHIEKIAVENGILHFKATSVDSISVIYGISVDEGSAWGKNTVLIMPLILYQNPFIISDKEFTYTLNYPKEAKRIYFGSRLIMADGEPITPMAAALYSCANPHVGNAGKDVALAEALCVNLLIGPFENQLETEKEPYGWTLIVQKDILPNDQNLKECYMESTAYVMLALIQNVDHITYQYTVDGKKLEKTITAADASKFFGQNIKNCYDDPLTFQSLLNQAGLPHLHSNAFLIY